jgi:uncharacterized protein (DUF697 family)
MGLSELLKLIPGFGTVAGAAGTSVLAGAITYGIGETFAQYFAEGGTFLAIDAGKLRGNFSTQFARGRKAVEEMVARKQTAKPPTE